MKKLFLVAVAAASLPFAARAESSFVTTGTPPTATARLDFTVTIPKVLFLQVGTGSTAPALATNGTVNSMSFAVSAGSMGNGTAVAPTGGDLPGGNAVTVRVLGNSGHVWLTDTTTGPLSSGVVGHPTIPWSDIAVTSGALATTTPGYANTGIAHPPFNTGAAGGVSAMPTILTATGGLVRREGSWTFAYANTATLPAGSYGSTPGNNGRVTYTATAP